MQKFYILVLFILILSLNSSKAQDDRINYNNQQLFLSGMNLAWIDFAGDVSNLNVDEFTRALTEIKTAGGNTMRWWLHTNGTSSPQFTNDSVTSISPDEISNLKIALDLAQEKGIGMIMCLWSFDMLRETNDDGSAALPISTLDRNELILINDTYMNAYIRNALIPLIDTLGEHPAVLNWEIFNEPEGMTSVANWGNIRQVPITAIQKFVNRTAGAIHRHAPNALVSNGSWSFIASTDIGSYTNYYTDARLIAAGGDNDGTLDFYTVHYYDWGGTAISPFHHPASYWELDKPLVIGEFAADGPYTGITTTQAFEYLYQNGYAGAVAWQWNGDFGGLPSAQSALEYMYETYKADIELLIDSSKINFAPRVVKTIRDTTLASPTDSLIIKYVDLKNIFYDIEDSVTLDYSVLSVSNTTVLNAEIIEDTLYIGIATLKQGAVNVTIAATDSGSRVTTATFYVGVYDASSEDKVLYRKVTASSIENTQHYAYYAVDGNITTRWSTEYEDDEWIMVEMEQVRDIHRIILNWESAFGEKYKIVLSEDGINWDTSFVENYGNGGYDLVVFPEGKNAKYVMMDGVMRGTDWGYSLFSFEVYETLGINTPPVALNVNDTLKAPTGINIYKGVYQYFSETTTGDALSFYATTPDGSAVPGWLSIISPEDPEGAILIGIPPTELIGSTQVINLVAKDRYGDSAVFEVKIVITGPVSVQQENLISINIFPNPATDYIFIEKSDAGSIQSIKIIDMQGRLVDCDFIKSTNRIEVNLCNLDRGLYFVRLYDGQHVITQKFIKE